MLLPAPTLRGTELRQSIFLSCNLNLIIFPHLLQSTARAFKIIKSAMNYEEAMQYIHAVQWGGTNPA